VLYLSLQHQLSLTSAAGLLTGKLWEDLTLAGLLHLLGPLELQQWLLLLQEQQCCL
jgi:hypothetical protein